MGNLHTRRSECQSSVPRITYHITSSKCVKWLTCSHPLNEDRSHQYQVHTKAMPSKQCTRSGSVRPKSSLSEHVARELQRDYPTMHQDPRRQPLKNSARGIKRFIFGTAGGVKRVSVATGKKGAKFGGTLKRSAKSLGKMAYNEWTYSDYYRPKNRNSLSSSNLHISTIWAPGSLSSYYSSRANRRLPTKPLFYVFFRTWNND